MHLEQLRFPLLAIADSLAEDAASGMLAPKGGGLPPPHAPTLIYLQLVLHLNFQGAIPLQKWRCQNLELGQLTVCIRELVAGGVELLA
jgi:hypothetical protein